MLLTRYDQAIAREGFSDDPAQRAALALLEDRARRLAAAPATPSGRFRRFFGGGTEPIPGVYLWGGVGRGKTFLMDLFFDALPFPGKRREHFHRFMRGVHAELRARGGQADPLRAVARDWGRELRVLCFDELFVSDIGDAMILGALLRSLFAEGVTLVATSNLPPARLYENGLQRRRFLPAIEALETHLEVVELGGDTDYRLRCLANAQTWLTPLGPGADAALARLFRDLVHRPEGGAVLEIEGRALPVRGVGDGVAWFDFATLCEGPRSAADYLELARDFHTLLLGDVPVLDARREDAARRLVTLVDVLYDHGVNLIVAAAAPLAEIYRGEALAFEFERTRSRLIEMRTEAYLHGAHTGQ